VITIVFGSINTLAGSPSSSGKVKNWKKFESTM
jgi:hypothetical protein